MTTFLSSSLSGIHTVLLFVCLLHICGLFNNAVSSSDYVMWNGVG
jgi:hypothetical protein